jgi:hypothetical protein
MAYSRRELFRGTLAGAATAAFVGAYERPVSAQTSLTPEAALQQLIDGNRRFAEGGMTSFNEDLNVLRAKTVDKQEPFAVTSRNSSMPYFEPSRRHCQPCALDYNLWSQSLLHPNVCGSPLSF